MKYDENMKLLGRNGVYPVGVEKIEDNAASKVMVRSSVSSCSSSSKFLFLVPVFSFILYGTLSAAQLILIRSISIYYFVVLLLTSRSPNQLL